MNDLFEHYIAVQLRRALAGTDLEVVAQGGFAYCLGPWREGEDCVVGDSHSTRPDILVKSHRRVRTVIDTKWKRLTNGVSHSDIYQMMAYSRLYACNHLILLYPALAGETDDNVDTRGIVRGPDRLDIASISLDRKPADIQARLSQMVVGLL